LGEAEQGGLGVSLVVERGGPSLWAHDFDKVTDGIIRDTTDAEQTMLADFVILATSLSALLVTAEEFAFPSTDVPVGCARICGPVIEAVDKCRGETGKTKQLKRQVPVGGNVVAVWLDKDGNWIPDDVIEDAQWGPIVMVDDDDDDDDDLGFDEDDDGALSANLGDGKVRAATSRSSRREEREIRRAKRRAQRALRKKLEEERRIAQLTPNNGRGRAPINIGNGGGNRADDQTTVVLTLIFDKSKMTMTATRSLQTISPGPGGGRTGAGAQPFMVPGPGSFAFPGEPANVFPGKGFVAPAPVRAHYVSDEDGFFYFYSLFDNVNQLLGSSVVLDFFEALYGYGYYLDPIVIGINNFKGFCHSLYGKGIINVIINNKSIFQTTAAPSTTAASPSTTEETLRTVTPGDEVETYHVNIISNSHWKNICCPIYDRGFLFPLKRYFENPTSSTRTADTISTTTAAPSTTTAPPSPSKDTLRTVRPGDEVEKPTATEDDETTATRKPQTKAAPGAAAEVDGTTEPIATSGKRLSTEENCVCRIESFDIARTVALCSSCIAQQANSAAKQKSRLDFFLSFFSRPVFILTLFKDINEIMNRCGFQPLEFKPADVASVQGVRVSVAKSSDGEVDAKSSSSSSNEAPHTSPAMASALFWAVAATLAAWRT
ncbi:hypothetical protein L249_5042, partial [Ophiocordyceps polyrhachis-furcata BCC 54312]